MAGIELLLPGTVFAIQREGELEELPAPLEAHGRVAIERLKLGSV